MTLSKLAKAFLAKKPSLIYSWGGHKYYECPERGDETFLVCITAEGKKKMTNVFEQPESLEEQLQLNAFLGC